MKRAGVADRDIQTSNVSLNPEYRYPQNESPQLTGYTATNQLTIRFRDIGASGKILDALVSQGANQINGPNLTIDKPEAALDEARANAVAIGRARAEALCALAGAAGGPDRGGLGKRRKLRAAAHADVRPSRGRPGGYQDRAGRAEAPG